jgi:tRNA G46 methylase TrmB
MRFLKSFFNEVKYWSFLYCSGGIFRIRDYLAENVAFDLQYGTNTSGWLETVSFEERPKNLNHGVRYRASYTSEVLRALKFASKCIDFSSSTFIDMGCGKGKVLMLAALTHNFKEIIGVDYYKPFLDIARFNIAQTHVDEKVSFDIKMRWILRIMVVWL